MTRRSWIFVPLITSVLVGNTGSLALGHGGGGGGGGGGGRAMGGGGARGGAGPIGGAHYGYGNPGYRSFGGHWGRPGYGWGYRGYGWGYPYYGLGLGLGLGYGLGYGYGAYSGGYGYPYYANYGYAPYNGSAPVATPYGSAPYVAPPEGTAPSGNLPSGTAPTEGPPPSPATGADAVVSASASSFVAPPPPAPGILPGADGTQHSSTTEFARRAEKLFRSGEYSKAVYAWRHAIVDDPQEPKLLLLLSQALFAMGRFDEAAGAAQAGMRLLPKEEWGSAIARYPELYGQAEQYTTQLRALEKAIRNKPKDPALRFLLGYHYSYLGFRREAIEQLDQVLNSSPRDEIARTMRKALSETIAKTPQPTKS